MHGVIPYPYYQKLKKTRRIAYTAVIVFGLLQIFFPLVAHADLFGFHVHDVYTDITENCMETNNILTKAFSFSRLSPWTVLNNLPASGGDYQIANAIHNATKTMALVTATLLLMVDFFKKSINFEWSSRWENILIFLIKIIVIKQVVQNADTIMGYIYSMFDSINAAATGTSNEFLPCGDKHTYLINFPEGTFQQLDKGWFEYWADKKMGNDYEQARYTISHDAVRMFYPNASFPHKEDGSIKVAIGLGEFYNAFPAPKEGNFFPLWEIARNQWMFIVMKAIAYIVFVIVIGRVFELTIYTIFAPLPLATFASDTTNDVAKSFIKNYIATILQIAVIVMMFVAFVATNAAAAKWMQANGYTSFNIMFFIELCALGLGVMRSGAWSKKICGIG